MISIISKRAFTDGLFLLRLVAISTLFQDGNGKHDPMLITIVNLTAVAIRRLIKIAKKINAFKNMCEEDQVLIINEIIVFII